MSREEDLEAIVRDLMRRIPRVCEDEEFFMCGGCRQVVKRDGTVDHRANCPFVLYKEFLGWS